LYVVHVGDSRCYLLRGGRLEQVTRDHTIAQQLVERGTLTPEQAEESRWSHILWNCLGGGSHELKPEVYKASLRLGDSLLLCSDGLSKVVDDARIRDLLGQSLAAEETCRRLVAAANAAGGPDNITVVVAHFREADEAAHAQGHAAQARAAGAPAELVGNRG
ncbi:MAG TPA: hypothetical protein VJ739_07025, partial [Gemmataceae bacterium]|nr:hypothetical protein [Gemmataceae bacterium]